MEVFSNFSTTPTLIPITPQYGDMITLIAEKGAQKYVEKLDSKKLDEFVKKLHSRQNKI